MGGIVLELTGFDPAIQDQPREVLDRMLWTYLLLPIGFWSLSILFLKFYKLDRKAVGDIRDQLEARRGEPLAE